METLQRLPFKARKSVFQKLEEIVDIASLSKEERMKYDEAIKVYRDNIVTRAAAVEEGMNKGRIEGKQEQKLEDARGMKNFGISPDIISQITGLSLDEIESL